MHKIKDFWDSGLYDDKHAFVFEYGQDMIPLLAPKSKERILDLGSGTGELTFKIGQKCREVIGLEKSASMLQKSRENYPTINFQEGNAADFSFSEKFDAIFSNATLHWVEQNYKAAQCMYNNLVRGGRIVVEFGGKGNVEGILSELRRVLKKKGFIDQSNLKIWYFPSIAEYSQVLESVGFRVVSAWHFDRETKLADASKGIIEWLLMFAKRFFNGIPEESVLEILQEVQTNLKTTHFYDGNWFADYKRIRIIALKK